MIMNELIQQARAIWEQEKICDRCLGRCFAKLGTGLANDERGKALRVVESMTSNSDVNIGQECSICFGIFESVDDWAHRIYHASQDIQFLKYLIGTRPPRDILIAEEKFWDKHDISAELREPFKQEFNREVGKKLGGLFALADQKRSVDFETPEIVLLIDLEKEQLQVTVNSLYIYGRYRKLVRTLPQTQWPCRDCKGKGCASCEDTGKQYPESVGELIAAPALEMSDGEDHAFHGAGREDIDALMLGSGRPFVLEIKSPGLRELDLETLREQVNQSATGKVEVSALHFVRRTVVEQVKEQKAQKSYRALVDFGKEVGADELAQACQSLVGIINQQTPQRVLHRRADMTRKREVFSVECEIGKKNSGYVTLSCDGGLYIKELISGDDGRTEPNLALALGTSAIVNELDVLSVDGDFPDSI
jgi:tRNA pseudouridine synthase 10